MSYGMVRFNKKTQMMYLHFAKEVTEGAFEDAFQQNQVAHLNIDGTFFIGAINGS